MESLVAYWLLLCLSSSLVGGIRYGEVVLTGASSGAVQVYLGDTTGWASVCSDGFWDNLAASIVCIQLGYENGSVASYFSVSWDYVIDLYISQVQCDKYDHSLIDCNFNTSYSDCTVNSQGFAGVRCISAGWSSSFYIGVIVMIFVVAACFSFFVRVCCGNKERVGSSGWSRYWPLSQNRRSWNSLVFPANRNRNHEDEDSLCHEPEDPELTERAPPSYSDAVGLSQVPPPTYSEEFETGNQAAVNTSQQRVTSSTSDSNNPLPPAYTAIVTPNSLPPSSSTVTNV